MNFLSIFFGTYIVGTYKSFGAQHIHDEQFLSVVGAFASIFGCLRFTWSFLIDHYTFKRVYGVLICLQTFLAFTFPLVARVKPLFLIWVSLTFYCEGGHFTLAPAIYKKLFGEEGSRVFACGFSFIGIASLVMIVMVELFFKRIGFEGFIVMFGGFNLVALILLINVFEEK